MDFRYKKSFSWLCISSFPYLLILCYESNNIKIFAYTEGFCYLSDHNFTSSYTGISFLWTLLALTISKTPQTKLALSKTDQEGNHTTVTMAL